LAGIRHIKISVENYLKFPSENCRDCYVPIEEISGTNEETVREVTCGTLFGDQEKIRKAGGANDLGNAGRTGVWTLGIKGCGGLGKEEEWG
jgi:hypothetical protein